MNLLLLAAEEGPNNPILPATNEIIWGAISFFLLMIVLTKVAYPPVRKAMEERTAKIQSEFDAVDKAQAEAAELKAAYEAKLAEAKTEAARIIDEAREQAEAVRKERLAALDAELAERKAQAEADLAAARERALAETRSQLAGLAVGAAERIVEDSLDEARYAKLVDNFIDRVGSQT